MKKLFFLYALCICVFLFASDVAFSATYEVKPNTSLDTIAEVPWATLQAGDTVLIHWRSAPYKEKWVICRQGTAANPITIRGVPNSNGDLPVIDGNGATTPLNLNFWNDQRGVIKIGGASIPADTMPKHIIIENLEIRSAHPNYQFSDDNGSTQTYANNAASIYVEKGENITIRNNIIHDSGNGLFVGSSDTNTSRDFLIEGNYFHSNGVSGSAFYHNSYTAGINMTFQYNRYNSLRSGANGNALKDRSAGTVVRYNWIEGGNRQLDLVEADDSSQIQNAPQYRQTFVYGNILIEPDNEGNSQILHYGGDNGTTTLYRKGKLYFYNNTIISYRSGNTTLFRLSTNDETADVRNNIFYTTASGNRMAITNSAGIISLTHNWFKPNWVQSHSGTPSGTVNNQNSIEGNSPEFIDEAAKNFRLNSTSDAVNAGTSLHTDAMPLHNVIQHYIKHQQSSQRPANATMDIGSFEVLAPTSAQALIVGRILNKNGRGIPRALIYMTDQNGEVRIARTNPFGYYRFKDVSVGETYTFNVFSKQYQFTPQTVSIDGNINGIDFIGF